MQWKVGKVKITKIIELEMLGGVRFVLPQATHEEIHKIEWLTPHFAKDDRLRMCIQSFIVETPSRRIIVDTGLGNDRKGRGVPSWNDRKGPFLQDLAAAGYPADTLDTVLLTHLHTDHVGWNTKLVDGRWVPAFPKARYIMGRREYDYWKDQRSEPMQVALFDDSIQPVVDAGLVDFIESDHRLTDELSVFSTPGHSPGHMSLLIRSEGEEAILTGDLLHHPCQMTHIDWSASVDYDKVQSAATRREFFSYYAGKPTLIIGGHFAGAGAGRVVKDGQAYRLEV